MTPQEELDFMCQRCEGYINQIPSNGCQPFKSCPWRSISNDHCGEYEALREAIDEKMGFEEKKEQKS